MKQIIYILSTTKCIGTIQFTTLNYNNRAYNYEIIGIVNIGVWITRPH